MSSTEYDMMDLLTLIDSEHADGLSLHPGKPPVVRLGGELHPVEGPPITLENASRLFRALADTRRVRELRASGRIEFVYRFADSQFRVQSRAEEEAVYIDLKRVEAQPDAGPNDEERDHV